jgi:hypothetical protein
MRNKDFQLAKELNQNLIRFSENVHPMPGIPDENSREALVEQIIESIRRVGFTSIIRERDISSNRANPRNKIFDPLRAAVLLHAQGDFEEACWLVFLAMHFGKHRTHGWETTAQVYGALGAQDAWTFEAVSDDIEAFRAWLDDNQGAIQRWVGNHRKYISLSGSNPHATGAAVESYIEWVQGSGSHRELFERAIVEAAGDPRLAFAALYKAMNAVDSFGRTGRFDYLSMIGKLGLANIEPDRAHLDSGATGPLTGSKLLFGGSKKSRIGREELEDLLLELGDQLGVGMSVVEDAICNWQKNPMFFVPYRG